MKRYWRKLGLLYCPTVSGRHTKILTHAANPLPVHLIGDIYRIYFSGRDSQNRSSVGAVDIDIVTRTIIHEHYEPFFLHGPEGSFYAEGVSIGNCYHANGNNYMLFMGWQTPENQHWRGDIGRLIVKSDLTLELDRHTAFMNADLIDPLSYSYPWVIQDKLGLYRMWYGSTKDWTSENGEMVHIINYATSQDGNHWSKYGVSVPYRIGVAQAFSRPTVIHDHLGFHMWFSYRSGSGETYRIGYATSEQGEKWVLNLDKSGITVSESGWDSEMIAYPFVFDHQDRRYMLYNGNGYGRTGFGLAVAEHY